jgi:hypothetical protein
MYIAFLSTLIHNKVDKVDTWEGRPKIYTNDVCLTPSKTESSLPSKTFLLVND